MALPQGIFKIKTHSAEETQQLGRQIGAWINEPISIALIGDLGSGKTAFVQGLAGGIGVPSDYYITSPTFTLVNEYSGRLPLLHIDLYRLETVSEFEDIGLDDLLCDQAVLAIEWADRLTDYFTSDYLAIHFEIVDDQIRKLKLIGYGQDGNNLIRALKTLTKSNNMS